MTVDPAPGTAEDRRERLAELLLERHRKLFPVLERKAYLNYGTQGALPTAAAEAIRGFYDDLDRAVPSSLEGTLLVLDGLRRARAALAGRLGAGEAERIALLGNTSTGCNVVLWGLPWREGDHLLLGDREYPGVVAAVEAVGRRFGLEVGSVPTGLGGERLLEALEDGIGPRTRLVVLSHVLWADGTALPVAGIAEVCRRRGVRLLIDGAQAVGQLPVELAASGVDFYAFPGHKWLCGPEGIGGLYVDPAAGEALSPTFLGARSFRLDADPEHPRLHADARRFETSTSSVALAAGLVAALETHDRWGSAEARWNRIRDRCVSLQTLLGGLGPRIELARSGPPESGLVAFRVAGAEADGAARIVRALDAGGAIVRSVPPAGTIRASVHYLTSSSDLDRLGSLLLDLSSDRSTRFRDERPDPA